MYALVYKLTLCPPFQLFNQLADIHEISQEAIPITYSCYSPMEFNDLSIQRSILSA
jgi:hypothetical protein